METSGFTEEQLTVRDAIFKICSNFSDEYWMEKDQTETYPHELHVRCSLSTVNATHPHKFPFIGSSIKRRLDRYSPPRITRWRRSRNI